MSYRQGVLGRLSDVGTGVSARKQSRVHYLTRPAHLRAHHPAGRAMQTGPSGGAKQKIEPRVRFPIDFDELRQLVP